MAAVRRRLSRRLSTGLLSAGLLLAACTPTPNPRPAFSPEQQLERGVKAYFDGQYSLAEKDLLEVTRRVPNDGMAWFRLGNLYMRQNQLDRAADAYQKALVRQSGLDKAWHNLGVVQLMLAQRHFQQLRTRLPATSPLQERAGYFEQGIDALLTRPPAMAGQATANDEQVSD